MQINRTGGSRPGRVPSRRDPDFIRRSGSLLRIPAALGLVAALLALGAGCLFRKNKPSGPPLPAQPIQLLLLPLNVPDESLDLRWVALSSPVLLAKELEHAPDIEVLPLWRGFPVAVEALGNSRALTPETAAFTASRAGSKWATQGEITPTKNGVKLLLDFIPVKATQIAYRYENEGSIDALPSQYRNAIEQFLRYLQVRPLKSKNGSSRALDSAQLKEISAALDREYGWFSTAEPGKAGPTFSTVSRTDSRLARLLFNPSVYSAPPSRPATPVSPVTVPTAPAGPSTPQTGTPSPPSPLSGTPVATPQIPLPVPEATPSAPSPKFHGTPASRVLQPARTQLEVRNYDPGRTTIKSEVATIISDFCFNSVLRHDFIASFLPPRNTMTNSIVTDPVVHG